MANVIYTTTQPPLNTYLTGASHNNTNGTDQDVLERAKICEICEGWGLYRWAHHRNPSPAHTLLRTHGSQRRRGMDQLPLDVPQRRLHRH